MLRLPRFDLHRPATLSEALEALSIPGSRIIAGGTDILPNLKHRLDTPPALVSLDAIEELRGIRTHDGKLEIGAGVTLAALSEDTAVTDHLPSLALAASLVAGPQLREMGTLGGNIHLDTRCRYVNQTPFWREAIGGGCLKSEGDVCHVVPKGRRCVAALSSDCVPVLISLDATVELHSPRGQREIPIEEYYRADGVAHIQKEEDELLVRVRIPIPKGDQRCHYIKWRPRKSIDFPLVSIALRFDLDTDGCINLAKVVVGVLAAKAKVLRRLDSLNGQAFSDPSIADKVADAVFNQCKPLPNVPYEPKYRRTLLRTLTRRGVAQMVNGPTQS